MQGRPSVLLVVGDAVARRTGVLFCFVYTGVVTFFSDFGQTTTCLFLVTFN